MNTPPRNPTTSPSKSVSVSTAASDPSSASSIQTFSQPDGFNETQYNNLFEEIERTVVSKKRKGTSEEDDSPQKMNSTSFTQTMNKSVTLPRFCATDLVVHHDRKHVITHIAGGYVQHIYDKAYIKHLNTHFCNFLDVWEQQVNAAKRRVKANHPYWPQLSHTVIDDFFELEGPFNAVKAKIKAYDGSVALQALDELTFYHALGLQDVHLFLFFHAAAHSRNFKLTFHPNNKDKSFKFVTEFSGKGSVQTWDLK